LKSQEPFKLLVVTPQCASRGSLIESKIPTIDQAISDWLIGAVTFNDIEDNASEILQENIEMSQANDR
jgi:hypothetical protein